MRLLSVLLLCGVASAQQLGSVTGRVLNDATNQPLKDAIVRLRSSNPPVDLSTATNSEGVFQLPGVTPGHYTLSAERPNFAGVVYGAKRAEQAGALLAIGEGQAVGGIDLRLVPQGVIAGKVLDEDGDPAHYSVVTAYRITYLNGRQQLTAVQRNAVTNDLGEYRIFGLAPGRYYVSATYRGANEALILAQDTSRSPDVNYVPVYYPDTPELRTAAVINLTAGRTAANTNITVRLVKGVAVRGTVVDRTGMADGRFHVNLYPQGPGVDPGRSATADAGGQFLIRGVVPGRYWAVVQGNNNFGPFIARQALEVSTTPVEGFTITLQAPFELGGKVRVVGGDLSGLRVGIEFSDPVGVTYAAIPPVPVSSDGSFRFNRVTRDRYEVRVTGLPDGYYVRSAVLGDADAWANGLDLTQGSSAPLEVVVERGAATLQGSIDMAAATVVLVPNGGNRRQRAELYRSASSDPQGRFFIPNVAPGDYKLFAWADIEDGSWMDPAVLSGFEERGVPVTIHERAVEQVTLKVIP